MRWQYILISVVILGVVVAAGVYFFFPPSTPTKTGQTNINPNPFGTPAGNIQVTNTQSTGNTIPVTLKDNSVLAMPNFIPVNQPEWANATTGFEIAGSGKAGKDGIGYDILYYPEQSLFSIVILDDPIGEKRVLAENILRTILGLSNDQLCKLSMQVFVIGEVSSMYAGRELGLSFCPGAIKLPQ